jgi:hypothetical protein
MISRHFAAPLFLALFAVGFAFGSANAQSPRELTVHLAQANNDSPYAFMRAKFEPGEVSDPWAVRFFDGDREVEYFVWDAITWKVARDGRRDWGYGYALLNHGPGDTDEVLGARAQKINWAKDRLPALGAKLAAQDQKAKESGDSVCAAMYLLRHRVPAFGKPKLRMKIYPERQVQPVVQRRTGQDSNKPNVAKQGDLAFINLPDRMTVTRRGAEMFRYAGFDAGGASGDSSHAEITRPFTVQTTQGIVTKVFVTGQTAGRAGGSTNWQSTYWLFPEGGYVALEGFAMGDTAGYTGGPQTLSFWQNEGGFTLAHEPQWEKPWWLHQAGSQGFVATHQFFATPLAIGYGNNPFTVNAEGPGDKEPCVELNGHRLALRWSHRVNDPAIQRLLAPQRPRRPSDPAPANALKPVGWEPKIDWLYRQYVVGLGSQADDAEHALRDVLGAAAGWIDRPISEEEIAMLLLENAHDIGYRQSSEIGQLGIISPLLAGDEAGVRNVLSRARSPVERTDYYINMIREHVARGGKPSEGRRPTDPDGTPREGWSGNACYHAGQMPCYIRVLEHFDLPVPDSYRDAVVRFADFTLDILGGKPVDWERLDKTCTGEWPSRIVPVIPVVLHAYTLKPEPQYQRAARMLFDDLMDLVERNPHGYFPAWTFTPKADKYDTVYNPVSYERGITPFWSEELLDTIERDRATRFVAAQARWMVFSGHLSDTLEIDNATAIRACEHGGHTGLRNQIGIYLLDDFAFYRGLVADLVAWSAATAQSPQPIFEAGTGPYRRLEVSNAGSAMLRWALGIRPGSKWLETSVERLAEAKGYRVRIWNRRPHAQPKVVVRSEQLGLSPGSDALEVRPIGPAYREPFEVLVDPAANRFSLKVNRPVTLRVSLRSLFPNQPEGTKYQLLAQQSNGELKPVTEGVSVTNTHVEWPAAAGEYELRKAER